MIIYNRWGQIVYETKNVSVGWDGSFGVEGRDAPQGVYSYKISYKSPNAVEKRKIVGHVTLIR
jgi:gliding motility-associated-like protein